MQAGGLPRRRPRDLARRGGRLLRQRRARALRPRRRPKATGCEYFVRHGNEVWALDRRTWAAWPWAACRARSPARARLVATRRSHDLRRGFTYTYSCCWPPPSGCSRWRCWSTWRTASAAPSSELTAGLGKLAAGDLGARVPVRRDDEIGRAIQAFNHMAGAASGEHRAPGLPDASSQAGRRWRARWRTR